ncbi:MAG: hypothetical protein AAFZ15_32660, partial [Bacteroidota bacterium]
MSDNHVLINVLYVVFFALISWRLIIFFLPKGSLDYNELLNKINSYRNKFSANQSYDWHLSKLRKLKSHGKRIDYIHSKINQAELLSEIYLKQKLLLSCTDLAASLKVYPNSTVEEKKEAESLFNETIEKYHFIESQIREIESANGIDTKDYIKKNKIFLRRLSSLDKVEIEKIKNFFKIQSASTNVIQSNVPKNNEKWEITRSVPSGIAIGINHLFIIRSLMGLIADLYNIVRLKPRKYKYYSILTKFDDARPYQYNIEGLKKKIWLTYLGKWATSLVSWHPTNPDYLVTAGKRGNVKLWDISTGQMLNDYAYRSSGAEGYEIEWMV